jgi:hypothetical protein
MDKKIGIAPFCHPERSEAKSRDLFSMDDKTRIDRSTSLGMTKMEDSKNGRME